MIGPTGIRAVLASSWSTTRPFNIKVASAFLAKLGCETVTRAPPLSGRGVARARMSNAGR